MTAKPRLAEDLAWNSDSVRSIVFGLEDQLPEILRDTRRQLEARYPLRREHGYAWSTWSHRENDAPFELGMLEVEVHDTGTVTAYSSRLAETWTVQRGQPEERVLLDYQLVAEVWRILLVCVELGRRIAYTGAWDIGVAGRGVKGATAGSIDNGPRRPWSTESPTYPVDEFESHGRVTVAEIEEHPGRAVERIVGRVLRVVGSTADVLQLLN